MWRVFIVLVILAVVVAGSYFYYRHRRVEARFLQMPVLFTAHAYSIDGLHVVPLYKDARRYKERMKKKNRVPERLYQSSVEEGEKLYVLDSINIMPRPGVTLKFYLVKTRRGGMGYIPDYFLAEKDGTPLAKPPRGYPIY